MERYPLPSKIPWEEQSKWLWQKQTDATWKKEYCLEGGHQRNIVNYDEDSLWKNNRNDYDSMKREPSEGGLQLEGAFP